ncbi:hypothetical protein PIB30_042432, partial [Stylosanthes scabra]|nr:hypothetical protein [Stylosanthes scabra]
MMCLLPLSNFELILTLPEDFLVEFRNHGVDSNLIRIDSYCLRFDPFALWTFVNRFHDEQSRFTTAEFIKIQSFRSSESTPKREESILTTQNQFFVQKLKLFPKPLSPKSIPIIKSSHFPNQTQFSNTHHFK